PTPPTHTSPHFPYTTLFRSQQVRDFPDNIKRLQQYFSDHNSQNNVRAIPGEGTNIPLWILGSSTDSAHLAAAMGLPYVFASHFSDRKSTRLNSSHVSISYAV